MPGAGRQEHLPQIGTSRTASDARGRLERTGRQRANGGTRQGPAVRQQSVSWCQLATLSATSFTPRVASTVRSPLPCRERARRVHEPGAAKKRNTPSADVTTSAVNSPVESSRRTYAPPTRSPPAVETMPVMTVSFSRSTLAGIGADWSGAAHPAVVLNAEVIVTPFQARRRV